ncbi:MAG: hypothetical protein HS122_06335 [Opitutaceae bacterium]|nr:hypothetical protein [Opitutaceae bacterium]
MTWYLKEIRSWLDADSARQNNQLQGRVFWRTDSFTAAGRIDSEIHGNGLANDRVYSTATGRLLHAAIDRAAAIGTSYAVQNLWYEYDRVGNVIERRDQASGRDERFYTAGSPGKSDGYDGLDRLMVHRVIGGAETTVAYNRNGNISSKWGVGNYSYSRPHAVGYAGSRNYAYDANGSKMSSGYGSNALYTDWTSFGQLWRISSMQTQKSALFSFDAAGQRVKQERFSNTAASGTPDETTIYVGGIYEKVGAGTTFEHRHYILAPTGRVAVHTDRTSLVRDTRFLHTDGLGSIGTISDERGRVVRLSQKGQTSPFALLKAQPKGSNLTFRTFEGQQPSPILPAWKNCWTENALAHREEYTAYNQVLGVVQSIKGINGLVTTWQHDGFGRMVREDRADGTYSLTNCRWPAAGAPSGTAWFVETESSGGAPAVSFHDKYGRTIETHGVSGDNRLVRQLTLYDGLGRVSAVSRPYYGSGPVHWTTTTYDAIGRPWQVVTPDEANGAQTTTYSYSNFAASATDPKGRVTETVRNSQGWVVSSVRNKYWRLGPIECHTHA